MPIVKLKADISLNGEIAQAGEEVKVSESLAKNLLNRDKAAIVKSDDEEKGLGDHTVPELKDLAEAAGIDGFSTMKKADLIAAIEALDDDE